MSKEPKIVVHRAAGLTFETLVSSIRAVDGHWRRRRGGPSMLPSRFETG
jgi:hypothetical protein